MDYAEVVMNLPRPTPSNPAARPVAIAEFASNDDGDFYRQCELAMPQSAVAHSKMSQIAAAGKRDPPLIADDEQIGSSGTKTTGSKRGTELTALQLRLIGLSTEGNITTLTRTGQKFSHGCVDLCIGTMTMLERVRKSMRMTTAWPTEISETAFLQGYTGCRCIHSPPKW